MTSEIIGKQNFVTARLLCNVEGVGGRHILYLGPSISEPLLEQDHVRAAGTTGKFPRTKVPTG